MPVKLRRFFALHAIACAVLAPLFLNAPVARAGPPVVETHDLDCGAAFPCPSGIQRRVDFWVKVFRSWETNQLIFHDRRRPARVYSVVTSEHSCHRSRSAAVEAERDRIEDILRTLAKKATWAEPGWTPEELEYLKLFPEQDAEEIMRAAGQVRCQTGNRDRFREALQRYGRYRSNILQVLREHDLSQDIVYLPFVESAYNPEAYSRAGAAGLWQIMPATARKLGLQLDATMDERFDPRRATWAAAKYLRHSTDVLTELARELDSSIEAPQVNPFVITSYNYGLTGMARAMRSTGPDYIKVLGNYRSRSFQTAVRNFYASFLAARYVARNAEKYFGPIETDGEVGVTRMVLKRPTSADRIMDVFDLDRDTAEQLNPALTRYVWRGWRLIPEGYTLNLPRRSDGWSAQIAKLEALPAEDPQLSGRQYVVARGDTACEIARAFAVQCRDLIQLNGLGRRALIRVGQTLDIPGKPKPTTSQRVASARDGRYTVRRGDTACEIARSFEVNCRELIRVNGLGTRALIHIGQSLRIPGLDTTVQVADAGGGSADSAGGRPGQDAEEAASPDTEPISDLMSEIDVAVRIAKDNGSTGYVTTVLPGETLGHYADWLGLGGTHELRELNGISRGGGLRLGTTIDLPIAGDAERLAFEADRFEFHQTLVDEFTQHYRVTGMETYTVRLGDTLWKIAARHDLPYWFLSRTNRGVDSPGIGEEVRVPIVEARNESKEPMVED